jgi:hypothetical protein
MFPCLEDSWREEIGTLVRLVRFSHFYADRLTLSCAGPVHNTCNTKIVYHLDIPMIP